MSPMVVSDAPNAQRLMRAIADADSGYYVFWSDLRDNPSKGDLYGQHFDSEGNALWTANGEQLMSDPTSSINQVAPLLMPDGSVIVSYMTGAGVNASDTARAMRFDDNANAMWTEPAVLLTGLDYRSMEVIPSDSCAYLVTYCESCGGGGYGCRMQRVRMDGSVQFALPGQAMASTYYGPFTIHPDGAGGLLFNIRCGNGAGTCLKAQRFDSLGTPVWPDYIDLADANGLNYAFSTTVDASGAQTAVWEVNGDLRMNRCDTLGSPLWTPTVQYACDLPTYVQGLPSAIATGQHLFIAWADNRPPASNADLYLQKYDLTTGSELWAADGVPVIQLPSYIPTPRLVPSDGGEVIGIMDGSSYAAMRVRADGSLAWASAVSFATANTPFYDDRVELPDGSGGVVAFWESSLGDVYGARIYRNGDLGSHVGLAENLPPAQLHVFPNPATDLLRFDLAGIERASQVDVLDTDGRLVNGARANIADRTIDLTGLAAGAYVARIRTHMGTHHARFIKQ